MLTLKLLRHFCTLSMGPKSCLRAFKLTDNSSPGKLAEIFHTTEINLRKLMLDPTKTKVDREEAELLGLVYGYKINTDAQLQSNTKQRTPVVTIMGHVDHGKTTLLDFLRSSTIAESEFGGITQKIGAFQVKYKGQKITFIDTPGHQAFMNMRLMGATVTDMIVLVVSAVEGVKPQTIEVIELANRLNIPMLVAINKIDIKGADPEIVEQELFEQGIDLDVENNPGGIVPVVHISAKTGMNVNLLAELILQQGKLYDINAAYNTLAEGFIIEANHSIGGQKSATIIVKKGIIKPGSLIVAGNQSCRVRTVTNDRGQQLAQALPGDAVEIVGFKDVPQCGTLIFEVQTDVKARYIVDKRIKKQREYETKEILQNQSKIKIKDKREKRLLYSGFSGLWVNKYKEIEERIKQDIYDLQAVPEKTESIEAQLTQKRDQLKGHQLYIQQYLQDVLKSPNTINIMLKTADRGTQETLLTQIENLKEQLHKQFGMDINILSSDVGDITLSDMEQGQLFNSTIMCFNTRVNSDIIKNGKYSCSIKIHKLIHTFLDDIKGLCVQRQKSLDGETSLKQKSDHMIADTFKVSFGKKGTKLAAGVKIMEGQLCKKFKVKIYRNNKPISGLLSIQIMKSFKQDVLELRKGDQCTLIFNPEVEFAKGDVIKTFD